MIACDNENVSSLFFALSLVLILFHVFLLFSLWLLWPSFLIILDSAVEVNGSTIHVLALPKKQGSKESGIVQLADYNHTVNDKSLPQLN